MRRVKPLFPHLDLLLATARQRGAIALDEPTGKQILAQYDVHVPRSCVVAADGDVRAASATLSAPFVLKVIAPEIVHKSDVGGVRLGLRDAGELEVAVADLQASLRAKHIEAQGWLIEEMIPGGVEVVVGGLTDPEFGPMVMVGLGGVFVEVLRDVSFRICPISERDAVEMIDELRGAPLLRGARGREAVSIRAIIDVLVALGGQDSLLMQCQAHVVEIDINPLIVTHDQAYAADARFILRPSD